MKPVDTGTRYDRTPAELQQYILTCILTAGKPAKFAETKVNDITEAVPEGAMPCFFLSKSENLDGLLREKRTGKYGVLVEAIRRIPQVNLASATLEDLLTIPGVGLKTARLFLLRTRPGIVSGALDTHMLKFLRDNGVANVPEKPPQSECRYAELEAKYLRLISEKYPELSPAEADERIWNAYRK